MFKKGKQNLTFFEHFREPEDLRCLYLQSECIHLGTFCSHTHRKAIAHKTNLVIVFEVNVRSAGSYKVVHENYSVIKS